MNIEVVELEPCKLNINYTADAGEILEKRGQVLQAFKKAPVPGFRKGKGSLDAIKIHYKNQIEESLKRGLAEEAYHNVLFEKKLKPHGMPMFKSIFLADGKFTCEFDLHVKPDFQPAPYKDMEIPRPHAQINPIELAEKMLQDLRVKFGEINPYSETDVVQYGDNVIIDYEGSLDGVKSKNLSAEGEMLAVGKSQFANFDESLLGMKLGETKEFDLLVPGNGLPSLIGKTVHFKVTLNMGSKSEPCALDDSLATKVGKKDLSELRQYVHKAAMGKASDAGQLALHEAINARLVNDNNIVVPNWLAVSEARYLAQSAKLDWEMLPDVDKEKFLELANKNVKLALILDKIREDEPEAQLSNEEVLNIIRQNIAKTQPVAQVEKTMEEMNKTGQLSIIMSRIKDQYAIDFIAKSVKIIE